MLRDCFSRTNHRQFSQKEKGSEFLRRCAFRSICSGRCLTLHLRRFLRRLGRHRGRKPNRLVASGGSNFIRFSPIDSILNLEDSRGSTLHLSRCDRRHRRRLSLVFALVDSCRRSFDGRIFSTLLGDSREGDARVEPPPAPERRATCNVFRHPITLTSLIIY